MFSSPFILSFEYTLFKADNEASCRNNAVRRNRLSETFPTYRVQVNLVSTLN